jgi:cytosine permease
MTDQADVKTGVLPDYLAMAKPNPMENRAPWYKNTAPTYAGIFLSVPFMSGMAGALQYGSVLAAFVGLFVGALFCFALYYVPAMLGLRTGMNLYVVGSSTFGTQGGILMPGLLMGVLQIGWHAVFTMSAANFLVQGLGIEAGFNSVTYWIICAVWGLVFAFVGAVGIGLLGALSTYLPVLPLIAIIIAGFSNMGGLSSFEASTVAPAAIPVFGLAMFAVIQATAGFFATAGAAGADFATNSRNSKDVTMGGLVGITVAAIVAGGFAILTIAGAIGNDPTIATSANVFGDAIAQVGSLSKVIAWVFVIACICPTGFCAFLAANSFSTMFPKLPRVGMTLAAGAIGVVLAATGMAANLITFFLLIGASFGPIIGAMTADYIRHGKWVGPRKGINWAGYIAWAVGFLVGILGTFGCSYGLETLMSFVVGFAVYLILADLGFEPETVELPQ